VKDGYGGEREEAGRRRVESGMEYKRARAEVRGQPTRVGSVSNDGSPSSNLHINRLVGVPRDSQETPCWKRAPGIWSWGPRGLGCDKLRGGQAKRGVCDVGWTRPGAPLDGGECLQRRTSTGMQKTGKRTLVQQIAQRGRAVKRAGKGATTDDHILRQLKARVTCPRARTSPSPPRLVVCHKGGNGDIRTLSFWQWHIGSGSWSKQKQKRDLPGDREIAPPSRSRAIQCGILAAVVRAGQGKAA
jgi:hypothetical protein